MRAPRSAASKRRRASCSVKPDSVSRLSSIGSDFQMKPAKRPPDPLAVFMHARRFRAGYDYTLNIKDPAQMALLGPVTLTLSAFSSELYLKALLCVETGRLFPGHNLKNLYRNLSGASRRRIDKAWQAHFQTILPKFNAIARTKGTPVPSGSLEDALDLGAHAFEAFRYAFEGALPDFLISDLPRLLDDAILDIRPEWRALQPAPPTFLAQIDPKLDGGPLPPQSAGSQ